MSPQTRWLFGDVMFVPTARPIHIGPRPAADRATRLDRRLSLSLIVTAPPGHRLPVSRIDHHIQQARWSQLGHDAPAPPAPIPGHNALSRGQRMVRYQFAFVPTPAEKTARTFRRRIGYLADSLAAAFPDLAVTIVPSSP